MLSNEEFDSLITQQDRTELFSISELSESKIDLKQYLPEFIREDDENFVEFKKLFSAVEKTINELYEIQIFSKDKNALGDPEYNRIQKISLLEKIDQLTILKDPMIIDEQFLQEFINSFSPGTKIQDIDYLIKTFSDFKNKVDFYHITSQISTTSQDGSVDGTVTLVTIPSGISVNQHTVETNTSSTVISPETMILGFNIPVHTVEITQDGSDPMWTATSLAMHMDGIDDSKSFIDLKNHSVTSYGDSKIVENSNPFLGRNDNIDVWDKVVLALDGESLTDLKGNTITPFGNVVSTTTEKKFGSKSIYFDGAGDYLSVPHSNSLNFGSNDLTIEMWAFPTLISAEEEIFAKRSTSNASSFYFLRKQVGGHLRFYLKESNNTLKDITINNILTQSKWYHVAIQHDLTTSNLKIFVDGIIISTTTLSGFTSVNLVPLLIGTGDESSSYWNGYIDSLVITKGIAKYTSNFDVPTEQVTSSNQIANIWNYTSLALPFNNFIDQKGKTVSKFGDTAIVEQGNPFDQNIDIIDVWDKVVLALDGESLNDLKGNTITPFGNVVSTTTEKKFGSKSIYFDGNGDYLTIPYSNNFDLSGKSFTLELYSRITASGWGEIVTSAISPFQGGYSFHLSSTGIGSTFWYANTPSSFTQYNHTYNFNLNQWYHIAFTLDGSILRVFVDGILIGSNNFTQNIYNASSNVYVGANYDGTTSFNGYIDSLVITKGIAKYTTNFTPPSEQVTSLNQKVDLYKNYVVLAMNMNGTNGSTKFLDQKGKVVTATGNAQISTANYKFGGSSAYFDGTGDYLSIPYSIEFDLSGDFSIEFWVNPSNINSTNQGLVSRGTSTTGFSIYISNTNKLSFTDTNTSASGTTVLSSNQWYFVSVVRNGNMLKMYIDGTLDLTLTSSTIFNQANTLYIGAGRVTDINFNGYIDDLRITKGVGCYISNFTPPTQSYLPSNKAVYFDGTGDYLSIPYNSDMAFGTGDFNIDGWINPKNVALGSIFAFYDATSSANKRIHSVFDSTNIYFAYQLNDADGGTVISVPNTFSTNQWTYFSFQRKNGILYIYLNDNLVGSGSFPIDVNWIAPLKIGVFNEFNAPYNLYLNGYISDLRITKGITRPISLPTTSYLLSGQSAYFDGSGDYLQIPHSSDLQFTGVDFTIECWIYLTESTANVILDKGGISGSQQPEYNLGVNNGKLGWWISTSTGISSPNDVREGTISITLNMWTHVVFERVGSVYKTFVNGILDLSTTIGITMGTNSNSLIVGQSLGQSPVAYFNGYISDLKIIKGQAKYTTNFVPPKTTFDGSFPSDPYWKNTKLLLNAPYQAITSQASNTVDYKNLVDNSVVVTGVNTLWQTTQKVNSNFQGAYYFDGVGDYLSIPHTNDLNIVNKNFTMEFFVSLPNTSGGVVFTKDGSSTNNVTFSGYLSYLAFYFTLADASGQVSYTSIPTTLSLTLNQWYHFAITKDNNTVKVFVDGILKTENNNVTQTMTNLSRPITIGSNPDGSIPFTGYIDQFRISTDIIRYTSNFTPPTEPFNNVVGVTAEVNNSYSIDGEVFNYSPPIVNYSPSSEVIVHNTSPNIVTPGSVSGSVTIDYGDVGDPTYKTASLKLTQTSSAGQQIYYLHMDFPLDEFGNEDFGSGYITGMRWLNSNLSAGQIVPGAEGNIYLPDQFLVRELLKNNFGFVYRHPAKQIPSESLNLIPPTVNSSKTVLNDKQFVIDSYLKKTQTNSITTIRSFIQRLPSWNKIKTTESSLVTLLSMFGIVSEIVYYYTKNYSKYDHSDWKQVPSGLIGSNIPLFYSDYITPHFSVSIDSMDLFHAFYDAISKSGNENGSNYDNRKSTTTSIANDASDKLNDKYNLENYDVFLDSINYKKDSVSFLIDLIESNKPINDVFRNIISSITTEPATLETFAGVLVLATYQYKWNSGDPIRTIDLTGGPAASYEVSDGI